MRLPFFRRNVQREIDEELRFHFDARIEELVGQGMTPDGAREQALREFGDVNQVRSGLREIDDRVARRRHRSDLLDVLRQDLVYAARSLRRTPAVSITIKKRCMLLSFEARLLQNAVVRARRDFVRWLSRNGDAAGFRPVLELPMTAFGRDFVPAVSLDPLDRVANLGHSLFYRDESGSLDIGLRPLWLCDPQKLRMRADHATSRSRLANVRAESRCSQR